MEDLETIRLISFGNSAVVAAAVIHGAFARRGIAVEQTMTPNSTEQMQGLIEGRYDIASTAFDNVLAWSGHQGVDVRAVAAASSEVSLPIVVRPEVTEWNDLRGKPLAVDAVDTAFALVLRRVLEAHGLDLDDGDYEFVPVGATGSRFESMVRGETFAAILNPPWDQRALDVGMKFMGDHRDVLPDYPGGVYALTGSFSRQHGHSVRRFLSGLLEVSLWMSDSGISDDAIKEIAALLDISGERTRNLTQGHAQDLLLDRSALNVVLELRLRYGLTPSMGEDLSIYLDPSFVEPKH